MYHLIMFTNAILYPVEVNIAEAAARNATGAEIEIFIDVHIEDGVEIDEVFLERRFQCVSNVWILQPVFQFGRLHGVENNTLDVISNQHLAKLEHLQHGTCRVVGDGVTLEHIFGARYFPSEPTLTKGCIHAKYIRQMTHFAAAAIVVILDTLRDCFHLKR